MGISGLLLIHCPVARELQATVVVWWDMWVFGGRINSYMIRG